MKTLTLLRHAKSDWDDTVPRDFDRPLNNRGRRAARTVGREMKRLGLSFDRVVASSAVRVRETLAEVEAAFAPLSPEFDKRLYLATPDTLLEIAQAAASDVERLLLVGHNPGLEQLVLALAGAESGHLRDEVEIKYPTATLAELRLPIDAWADLREGTAELTRFIRPRDLDPTLGPDSV
ncbi:MAG TPA: histidine phosphatase family protein [Allosphingosinicella sp.]|jgi:phosphohistidine phosphatase